MTASFHKFGGFFPGTGDVSDTGVGRGKSYAVNFPLKDGIDDDSYREIFMPVMTKVMEWYQPGAVVLQCGADSLTGDRLGCFNLSLLGHAQCVDFFKAYNVPLLLLGGGGYTVRNVSRCWAYETSRVVGAELCDGLPFNDNLEFYAPEFRLHIVPSNMENHNTRTELEANKVLIMEQLRSLPFAPSVPVMDTPRASPLGVHSRDADSDADDPDVRHRTRRAKMVVEYEDSDDELIAGSDDLLGNLPRARRRLKRPGPSGAIFAARRSRSPSKALPSTARDAHSPPRVIAPPMPAPPPFPPHVPAMRKRTSLLTEPSKSEPLDGKLSARREPTLWSAKDAAKPSMTSTPAATASWFHGKRGEKRANAVSGERANCAMTREPSRERTPVRPSEAKTRGGLQIGASDGQAAAHVNVVTRETGELDADGDAAKAESGRGAREQSKSALIDRQDDDSTKAHASSSVDAMDVSEVETAVEENGESSKPAKISTSSGEGVSGAAKPENTEKAAISPVPGDDKNKTSSPSAERRDSPLPPADFGRERVRDGDSRKDVDTPEDEKDCDGGNVADNNGDVVMEDEEKASAENSAPEKRIVEKPATARKDVEKGGVGSGEASMEVEAARHSAAKEKLELPMGKTNNLAETGRAQSDVVDVVASTKPSSKLHLEESPFRQGSEAEPQSAERSVGQSQMGKETALSETASVPGIESRSEAPHDEVARLHTDDGKMERHRKAGTEKADPADDTPGKATLRDGTPSTTGAIERRVSGESAGAIKNGRGLENDETTDAPSEKKHEPSDEKPTEKKTIAEEDRTLSTTAGESTAAGDKSNASSGGLKMPPPRSVFPPLSLPRVPLPGILPPPPKSPSTGLLPAPKPQPSPPPVSPAPTRKRWAPAGISAPPARRPLGSPGSGVAPAFRSLPAPALTPSAASSSKETPVSDKNAKTPPAPKESTTLSTFPLDESPLEEKANLDRETGASGTPLKEARKASLPGDDLSKPHKKDSKPSRPSEKAGKIAGTAEPPNSKANATNSPKPLLGNGPVPGDKTDGRTVGKVKIKLPTGAETSTSLHKPDEKSNPTLEPVGTAASSDESAK